ncbi:hypothetical protein [Acetivibrio straminisolvens]|uniref:Osmosensitive K+ channel histidine kinase KdpD n=1 Tax=Acetivibrio straminisolvens JCM 21531 TaxID=1294263 RepID=W4V0X1_9FIRM|nr:hypothetical protein [Acetivibrio straminisolvens]GAE87140.1 osmosensitive K+ channel histidine kinase KdpD [Acetivibrio straminisolvens JCM 21531]
MKKNTIKWRIFKYNIIAISVLLTLTTVVFNITIQSYIENDIKEQLSTIAQQVEDTALFRGPDFCLLRDCKNPVLCREGKTIFPGKAMNYSGSISS